jgi:hypothetical protein
LFFLDKQAVFRVGGGFEVMLSGAPVKGGHLGDFLVGLLFATVFLRWSLAEASILLE